MATIQVEVPEEAFTALRRSPHEFARELRLAAAIHWYSRGTLSQERATAIAGLDRLDFLHALAREGVDVFGVDMESFATGLAADRSLGRSAE